MSEYDPYYLKNWLDQKGVCIKVIQYLLGHQDIKTTLIYTYIANDDWYKAIKILDNCFNNKN